MSSGDHKASKKGIVIGLGEVEVPEYLNKPEMVTRLSAGRITLHDKERWAGSLPKNIQSVLRHSLSAHLPQYTFLSYPWEEPISDRYRIHVTIERFDGDSAGLVTLEGRWSLVDQEENRVLFGEPISYREQGGITLDAIVDTQSSLLEKLSRHIAGKIRSRI
jgi:uncharacterized lipoprotein YmbA